MGNMSSISEFIQVTVDMTKCAGIAKCGGCVHVCPVSIFGKNGDQPAIVEKNLDECILCELCLQACTPGAITIRKLYDEG
jgi:NAD-dependent dihydropyrimidine dehydrogenase PreA subunit